MQLPGTPRAELARSNVVSRVSVILFDFLTQIAGAGYAGLVTGPRTGGQRGMQFRQH